MEEKCFFDCVHVSARLIDCGEGRVENIRKSSIRRGDGLASRLEGLTSIRCHKNCVSSYTSDEHIQRSLGSRKGASKNEEGAPQKKIRRSGSTEFAFKKHCIFCGTTCLPMDPRHPKRWRKVVQCQTAGDFKERILQACDRRKDSWSEEVRVRISGAVSDLHAADGQYHHDCCKQFMSEKNIQATAAAKSAPIDPAFMALTEDISKNKSRLWNSLEIEKVYLDNGGTSFTRRKIIEMLTDHFGDDLVVLSGNGVASIIVFRSQAPTILRLEENASDIDFKSMAKTIRQECSEQARDKNVYSTSDVDRTA